LGTSALPVVRACRAGNASAEVPGASGQARRKVRASFRQRNRDRGLGAKVPRRRTAARPALRPLRRLSFSSFPSLPVSKACLRPSLQPHKEEVAANVSDPSSAIGVSGDGINCVRKPRDRGTARRGFQDDFPIARHGTPGKGYGSGSNGGDVTATLQDFQAFPTACVPQPHRLISGATNNALTIG